MFQTMQTNSTPQQTAIFGAIESQAGMAGFDADLLAELRTASDNVLRLAAQVRAQPDADAAETLAEQHAIAQRLIGRLLTMPVAPF
ncbi:hypothetical protein P9239_22395 [Caballeronia sp. LZ062]|uniref:hypothetical protein n=1 Tax=unclassified Caballeronia TaxID=2646786 RepID=UPI00285ABFAC|nr:MULTISPECIES: hypothetical protein [unclassified Caballeronia]MDR5856435.1 hypothetical protein [Caballeronia sp. LZ050]MDR5873105.1 hypothetical protein [Caballeronia sp. LZ062]